MVYLHVESNNDSTNVVLNQGNPMIVPSNSNTPHFAANARPLYILTKKKSPGIRTAEA